jgi:MFS family permease
MLTCSNRAVDQLVDREAVQRRTLRVLVAGQVLGGAAIGVSAAASALVAADILGSGTFAGLAFAAFAFGAAGAAVPLSRGMARRGRRYGLTRGYTAAALGALGCVVAAQVESFPLLLVGLLLFGAGNASNLLSRYTAADLAPPDRRARAISTVVWATTVGAVAGPNVLGPAKRVADAVDVVPLAGPFVVSVGCFVIAGLVISLFLRPDPLEVAGLLDVPTDTPVAPTSIKQTLREIGSRPDAVVGLATMSTAHAVMISVMSMTPLHLRDHGDSLELVGVVISLHIAGMYALAPVVGAIADRVGHLQMARTAAVTLLGASALAAAAGHNHVLVATALVLLGLAWSMATISGSAILVGATPPADRARTQGVADMVMGFMGGTGGTVAGLVVGLLGYATLSLAGAALALGLFAFIVARTTGTPRTALGS